MLTQTVDAAFDMGSRKIFTAPGVVIPRPVKTLVGTIIISVLIFLQLIGLAYTVRYIYQVLTWTSALDAIAVARIGASLKENDLPPIGPVYKKDNAKLKQLSGLVGVVEEEPNNVSEGNSESPRNDNKIAARTNGENNAEADSTNATTSGTDLGESPFRLGLGAPGLITRRLAPPKKKKKSKKNKTKQQPARLPLDV